MTVNETNPSAAGGQPPATTPPATPPSSGGAAPVTGEHKAADGGTATPAPQAKDDAAKAKGNDGGKPPVKTLGAPASYDLKSPEQGYQIGDETQTALTEVARELDLTNEAAQKIVDKMSPALRAQTQRNITAMIDGWKAETIADPKIGGAKLQETLALAARGRELASPELRKLLGPPAEGGSGLGEHKAVIAFFADLGRKLSPDSKIVSGGEPTPPRMSPEARMAASSYNNS